jgi:sentrin-specific protease 1
MTLEQAEKLAVMLNLGSKVLVNGDKISVRGTDLITLKKRGWLNDEVINFYVELILKRAASEPEKYPKIHMFNTFFYPLLEKKGYSGVAMITKKAKIDIFSLDMVIVPIHLQIHWALVVINIKERRLEYYDSMSKGYNDTVLSSLKRYVEEEYKNKKGVSSYDMSEWKYYRVENLPRQTNAYDCGVFAMTFAEHISRGASVLFAPPKHMKYFRLKMMWEIINSKLLPVDHQTE